MPRAIGRAPHATGVPPRASSCRSLEWQKQKATGKRARGKTAQLHAYLFRARHGDNTARARGADSVAARARHVPFLCVEGEYKCVVRTKVHFVLLPLSFLWMKAVPTLPSPSALIEAPLIPWNCLFGAATYLQGGLQDRGILTNGQHLGLPQIRHLHLPGPVFRAGVWFKKERLLVRQSDELCLRTLDKDKRTVQQGDESESTIESTDKGREEQHRRVSLKIKSNPEMVSTRETLNLQALRRTSFLTLLAMPRERG